MAICIDCAKAGDNNRRWFNNTHGEYSAMTKHPTDCGCPCQHEAVRDWESYYMVEEPKR